MGAVNSGALPLQTLGLWRGIGVCVVHVARGNADHIISIRMAESMKNASAENSPN